jgi:hypothetical protein
MGPAEQRYAQVEKYALAVKWACEKLSDFLISIKFSIETDHKSLIYLYGAKAMSDQQSQIQRLHMRLMRYAYKIKNFPGKKKYKDDAL